VPLGKPRARPRRSIVAFAPIIGWLYPDWQAEGAWRHEHVAALALTERAGAQEFMGLVPGIGLVGLEELVHRDQLTCECPVAPEGEGPHWSGS
jgi:hypothetical protein